MSVSDLQNMSCTSAMMPNITEQINYTEKFVKSRRAFHVMLGVLGLFIVLQALTLLVDTNDYLFSKLFVIVMIGVLAGFVTSIVYMVKTKK